MRWMSHGPRRDEVHVSVGGADGDEALSAVLAIGERADSVQDYKSPEAEGHCTR